MPKKDKKTGLLVYEPGEIIFKEKENAQSLFIIQKGQIRLFVEKGKGYVDLAILRSGEVIGEMAYFYGEKSKVRSCSAAAISETTMIEISFDKLSKTLETQNPWFKTIVNTLADRVRLANDKIRSLEADSVGYGKDGRRGNYVFFNSLDIVKALAYFYMIFKSQADVDGKILKYHRSKIKIFMVDIFGFKEVKFEEFVNLLSQVGYIKIENDDLNKPNIITIEGIEEFRKLFMYYNNERVKPDEKKLLLNHRAYIFLEEILKQVKDMTVDKDGKVLANLTVIIESFKKDKVFLTIEDLDMAKKFELIGEAINAEGGVLNCEIYLNNLNKLWPCIKLQKAIDNVNEEKRDYRN